MGCSIQFVRTNDSISDVDSIDLSANGYALANDGYFQSVAPIDAKSVHESITLKLQGTSKDDLAAMTQEIDEKIKQVEWWMKAPSVERYQVWLRVQLDNETYPRQAQILNIQPPDRVKTFTPTEINANYIGEYQIGIERTPFWEAPNGAYVTTTESTTVNSIGGMYQIGGVVAGDVPARIVNLTINEDGLSSLPNDIWIGFRSTRLAVPANFVSVINCSDSTYFFDAPDTSSIADATAINGYKIRSTFASDATLQNRFYVSTGAIGTQRGTFTVLLRAKMSDSSVARVQLGFFIGLGPTSTAITYRSRVVVSGTVWNLYELGDISIPPLRTDANHSATNNSIGVNMRAERISGSGSIDFDVLILIPKAEGFIKVGSDTTITSASPLAIYQRAENNVQAFLNQGGGGPAGQIVDIAMINPIDYGLPTGSDVYAVVAACSRNVSIKSEEFNLRMQLTYIPRWRTLRGNAT